MEGIKTRGIISRLNKTNKVTDETERMQSYYRDQIIRATNTWALREFMKAKPKHTQEELVKFMSGMLGMELG